MNGGAVALNADRVGHAYPVVTYEVSRPKIREYAAALGETDPRYFSDGDDCVAPPTFAACFTIMQLTEAMLGDDQLGAHTNLVHGSQSYAYGSRAVRPGDVLALTPRIADIATRRGNEVLTVEIDCRFTDGDERAVLSTTGLVLFGSTPTDDTTARGGDR